MRQPFLCEYKLCLTNSNVVIIIGLILSYSPFPETGYKFWLIYMRISSLLYRERATDQHIPYANMVHILLHFKLHA